MNLLSLYLWSLIAAPAYEPAPPFPNELRPLLHGIAIALEIYDQNEADATLKNYECAADISFLRHWYGRLRDCPTLSDAAFLPPIDVCEAACGFNREYACWLRARADAALLQSHLRREWVAVVIKENDRLYAAWDAAAQAQRRTFVSSRREALNHLRDALGGEAYYAGLMPPWVPVWRFERR